MVTDVASRQYPHYLYKRTSNGEAVQDANGSWQASGRGMDATQRLPRGNQREGYADTSREREVCYVRFANTDT